MPEIKTCERCGTSFTCRADDIKNCQCYAVNISIQRSIEIKEQFRDCLCAVCLNVLAEQNTANERQGNIPADKRG